MKKLLFSSALVISTVFAACSLGAASATEQEFPHGHMVILDQRGLVNQPLPLGISLTGNSENKIVVLEGLVEGTQLSIGVSLGPNRWSLPAEDADKAFVGPPHDFSGTIEVTAKLYSTRNELLQSEVIHLGWTRGEGAIPSGNPVASRAGVDPPSGVKTADAAPLAPASEASPALESASAPIVAANPSSSDRAAQADSPASSVSVPETKSSQPGAAGTADEHRKAPPVLDRARRAEDPQGANRLASPANMYTKAPPAPAAPVLAAPTWTGTYVGINGGYGWGTSNHLGFTDDFDIKGGLAGVTYGGNWQAGNAVLGFESDFDWADIKGTSSTGVCAGGDCFTKTKWLSTERLRAGWDFNGWLLYGTAGAAFARVDAGQDGCPDFLCGEKTHAGWTAGVGVETMFWRNWSAKLEYLHYDVGDYIHYGNGVRVTDRADIVRAGINYHFDFLNLLHLF